MIKKHKKTKTWIWVSLIVVALIIGGFVGAKMFSKTNIIFQNSSSCLPSSSGNCDYSSYQNQIVQNQNSITCLKNGAYNFVGNNGQTGMTKLLNDLGGICTLMQYGDPLKDQCDVRYRNAINFLINFNSNINNC